MNRWKMQKENIFAKSLQYKWHFSEKAWWKEENLKSVHSPLGAYKSKDLFGPTINLNGINVWIYINMK